jgi:hypothetical protein
MEFSFPETLVTSDDISRSKNSQLYNINIIAQLKAIVLTLDELRIPRKSILSLRLYQNLGLPKCGEVLVRQTEIQVTNK